MTNFNTKKKTNFHNTDRNEKDKSTLQEEIRTFLKPYKLKNEFNNN